MPQLVGKELAAALSFVEAASIVGPKWRGKARTAPEQAKSPIWQMAPVFRDAMRNEVDERGDGPWRMARRRKDGQDRSRP